MLLCVYDGPLQRQVCRAVMDRRFSLSLAIVNYSGASDLERCFALAALKRFSPLGLCLVDNASER